MKNNKKKLTQALIERAICSGNSYSFLWDTKQDGLGVKIEPSGHKSYVIQYRSDGKYKRKAFASCTKINLDQARTLANEYQYKISKGENPFAKDESKNLYELTDEYIEMREIGQGRYKKVSKNTIRVWKSQVKNHLKDAKIGKKKIATLMIADATEYMERLSKNPVIANRMRSLLSLVFDYSIRKGLREIGTNIWDYVDKYEEKPERPRFTESTDEKEDQPTKFMKYMHEAEMGIIKDGLGYQIDLSWVYMVQSLYFCGARPDDICDLKIAEIDFENSIIHRDHSKTGAKDIPISKPFGDILRKALTNIKREKGNPYLFAGKNGKGYRLTYGGRQWENLQKATGISAPPYALRRYFALVGKRVQEQRGGSIAVVSQLMGHATTAMTEMYAGEDKQSIKKEQKILVLESERVAKKLQKNINPA